MLTSVVKDLNRETKVNGPYVSLYIVLGESPCIMSSNY